MGYFGLTNRVSRSVPVVSSMTSRNLIMATGEGNMLGLIKRIKMNQERRMFPRYEIGQDEVAYIAPGPIDGGNNILEVEKFLVFETNFMEYFGESYSQGALLNPNGAGNRGGLVQGKDGYPQTLLDFNKPFDILIFRRGMMNLTGSESGAAVDLQRAGGGAALEAVARQGLNAFTENSALLSGIEGFQAGGIGGGVEGAISGATNFLSSTASVLNPFTGGPAGAALRAGRDALATGKEASSVVTGVNPSMGEKNPYNLIIYKAFRECWIKNYSWESDVGEGEMRPIMERITIQYTYMEGHASSKDDGGKEIGKRVGEAWKERYGN